jgi:hypothetical protein
MNLDIVEEVAVKANFSFPLHLLWFLRFKNMWEEYKLDEVQ